MFENAVLMSDIQKGFYLMGFGITGVFIVLILFFFLIKALVRFFPDKPDSQNKI